MNILKTYDKLNSIKKPNLLITTPYDIISEHNIKLTYDTIDLYIKGKNFFAEKKNKPGWQNKSNPSQKPKWSHGNDDKPKWSNDKPKWSNDYTKGGHALVLLY